MSFNPFIGWSQDDLEAQLRLKQEDLASGKTVIEVAGGDTSGRKAVETSTLAVIQQLLIALNRLDPVQYPLDQIRRASRTRAVFAYRAVP